MIFVADWYNADLLRTVQFTDPNTMNVWYPETGGCNIPAANDLLSSWGIGLGEGVFDGALHFAQHSLDVKTSTHVAKFPSGGFLVHARLEDAVKNTLHRQHVVQDVGLLGLYRVPQENGGMIVVFCDSSSFDSAVLSQSKPSLEASSALWKLILTSILSLDIPSELASLGHKLQESYSSGSVPRRAPGNTLHLYSKVALSETVQHPLPICWSPSPIATSQKKIRPNPRNSILVNNIRPITEPTVPIPQPDSLSTPVWALSIAFICFILILVLLFRRRIRVLLRF